MSIVNLLSSFHGNSGASEDDVANAEIALGFKLPVDCRQFMKGMDGGEGFIGEGSYLMLWSVRELAALNVDYETSLYCPGVVLIGSSGGGEAFGMDRFDGDMRFIRVPFIGMSRSLIEVESTSFEGFLESIGESDEDEFYERHGEELRGMEIYELHPVILGGSPNDPSNRTAVTRAQHIQLVRYWNREIQQIQEQESHGLSDSQ